MAPVESVRLGARFGWCPDVQGAWDSAAASLSATIGVVAAYYEALLAADTAADDLDRAEAAARAAALERQLDDGLDGYFAVIAASSAEPRTAATDLLQVAEGIATATSGDGTQTVAYQRARTAYTAAAGEADMALLEEFFGIQRYWKLDPDERVEQLGLPLPAAVHATLKVRELLDPPRLDASLVFNALDTAYGVVYRVVRDSNYAEPVGNAADWLTRVEAYEHLLSEDTQPAIDAYEAEAGSYETVIADALDTALDAVSVLYAEAEAADLDVDERIAVQRTAAAAAEEIVWELLTDAKQRLQNRSHRRRWGPQ